MKRYMVRHSIAVGAAIAMLVGCGGGGGSGGVGTIPNQPVPTAAPSSAPPTSSPATPTPSPPIASGQTIFTHFGSVAPGLNGKFSPNEGDTPSGGAGAPIDGVTCDPTMSNNYHVHFYLGVFVNGQLYNIPSGLGMENPVPPSNGIVNAATCFYHIHTHDESGIIHVEDPNTTGQPTTASKFTLKTLFDIWGITVNSNQFGQFSGPVRVFTSGQQYRGDQNNGTVSASTLTFWGSDANSIPIYSHELIFIEVGPNYPASLPNVNFYTEF